MLKAADIYKSYDGVTPVLRGMTLAVEKGHTLALVGESGCGKSTLARIITRLDTPDAGQLTLDGQDYGALRGRALLALRKRVQMVFQDAGGSLDPRRTIYSALAEPLANFFSLSRAEKKQQVATLLQDVGLAPQEAQKYPHQLSGGQRQRVVIARALAAQPDYIICDEPVSSLDIDIQHAVLHLLQGLQRSRGLGCLFITHDLALAASHCDELAVMQNGAVLEQFAAGRQPQTAYGQLLFGAGNSAMALAHSHAGVAHTHESEV